MTTTSDITAIREVPIASLVIRSPFSDLWPAEATVIGRITEDMQANGFDPAKPVHIWADGDGQGRHVLVEGHQRTQAARGLGLKTIRAAYRHFADETDALLWAMEQQANRRNANREQQCLAMLRALRRAGQPWGTTAELVARFSYSQSSIDRSRQVIERGTESEIMAVLDGSTGLKRAYELIRKREAEEAEPLADDDGDKWPEQREQPSQADEVQEALDRRQLKRDLDEVPEEVHEALDQINDASATYVPLAASVMEGDIAGIVASFRNSAEALVAVGDAIAVAYPPAEQTLTILLDGHELDEDENARLVKEGLKRCQQCYGVKPLAEFPTTPVGKPDRRRKGRGEWCSECADAPDPTISAGARASARAKLEAKRAAAGR